MTTRTFKKPSPKQLSGAGKGLTRKDLPKYVKSDLGFLLQEGRKAKPTKKRKSTT